MSIRVRNSGLQGTPNNRNVAMQLLTSVRAELCSRR